MITANEYLNQVQDTIEHIFSAIDIEEDRISEASKKLPVGMDDVDLRTARDSFYKNFASMELHEDFDDRQVMHAFHQYTVPAQLIILHEITSSILYGTLLQIAKQAISLAHGKGGRGCGLGKEISGMSLAQIIWDSRNQSLHFEEEAHKNTRETFDKLSCAYGKGFSLDDNLGKNMARGIVREILRWRNRADFENDMRIISGAA